jgi:hypothetical protein
LILDVGGRLRDILGDNGVIEELEEIGQLKNEVGQLKNDVG